MFTKKIKSWFKRRGDHNQIDEFIRQNRHNHSNEDIHKSFKHKRVLIIGSLLLITTLIASALFIFYRINSKSISLFKEVKPESTAVIAQKNLPKDSNATENTEEDEGITPNSSENLGLPWALETQMNPELVPYRSLLEEAWTLASGYWYDEAIETIKNIDGYEQYPELTEKLEEWNEMKSSLVEWDVNQTTHVFFHSLIVDASKAFNGSYKEEGYDNYMVTVTEFNHILESMYQKGYLLVTPYQLALYKKNKKGDYKMTAQKLYLPKGKKAFVLSVDDVSYYQYMEGDGFASRLVVDENGKITNEMDMEDGTVQTGDFDVVPLLERFLEKHPDFSYQGAKGVLALTGYDGVLGYRTSKSQHEKNKEFKEKHPNYDYKDECKKAKAVAKTLKDTGWIFANHSYSHNNIGLKSTGDKKPLSYTAFKKDITKWIQEVEPILGKTDIIIFPQGTYLNEPDRPDWKPYSKNNKRYRYLTKQGIRYFFGVGGYQPWVQLTNEYFRQDRINIDGTGMRNHPKLYKPFFDPKKIYDAQRPTPLK